MKTLHVMTCPLEPQFHFYNTCPITCIYNSDRCKYNCIQLGTNQDSETRALSSSEILFYRGHLLEDHSIKNINALKKEATARIQTLYAFNYFLEFARTTYFDLRVQISTSEFKQQMKSSRITNLLARYPYNIPIFKILEEDLVLLFTESIFEHFKKSHKMTDEITYQSLLGLGPKRLRKARSVLAKYLRKKEIMYEFSKEKDQESAGDQDRTTG